MVEKSLVRASRCTEDTVSAYYFARLRVVASLSGFTACCARLKMAAVHFAGSTLGLAWRTGTHPLAPSLCLRARARVNECVSVCVRVERSSGNTSRAAGGRTSRVTHPDRTPTRGLLLELYRPVVCAYQSPG